MNSSHSKTIKVVSEPPNSFDLSVETLIIGAGACGLVSALAAQHAGQDVLVLERDALPRGSTALSAGLIPAAGTSLQRSVGINDSAACFATDIQTKANFENDSVLVDTLTSQAAGVIEWLMDTHHLPFSLVDNFDYPGHSKRRMHGLPSRAGSDLIDALRKACEINDIIIACNRQATTLFMHGDAVQGVGVVTQSGDIETISCKKLVLACNGFGGNRTMVDQYLADIKEGLWFGHDGNCGEAILWGESIHASIEHLGAYQGHGNVAHPHGILITWAVITEGGIQVNRHGERFWNESLGYSEAARKVLMQPEGTAITIFDERIAAVAQQFEDYKHAESVGAIKMAPTIEALSEVFSLPAETLQQTLSSIPATSNQKDQYGRVFPHARLQAPYYGVKVTGALFHTQGGLAVNSSAQVKKRHGGVFPNLYAGGGAACGVSGKSDSGYLSGNGLLSAVVLGYLAGTASVSL